MQDFRRATRSTEPARGRRVVKALVLPAHMAFGRTEIFIAGLLFAMALLISGQARAEWKVDFSRRSQNSREAEVSRAAQSSPSAESRGDSRGASRGPASEVVAPDVTSRDEADKKRGIFDVLFDAGEPVQEIVVLHTEKGFVPSTIRVRKNGRYKIHVVNVNEKEKNVSFILDGFSEHHATYFGKIKTFTLEPRKEGAFSFVSPETSAEGHLVVFNSQMVQPALRGPAAAEASGR